MKKLKEFKGKKVTIIGLGLHGGGVAAAKFFSKLGAKVLVTDLRRQSELKESLAALKGYPITYILGQHRPEDFINTDLVIKNPAVPENSKYLQIAREHKVAIDTDVGIFFEFCPGPIIGVSGTKGKSTTASLIAAILDSDYDLTLAGNIRRPVLNYLRKMSSDQLAVLELSSWQLAGLRPHQRSPHCAVLTNIFPDHLNRYSGMEEYIEDKKEIFKWQKKKDYLVINYDDPVLRELAQKARSQVFYFSQEPLPNGLTGFAGAFSYNNKIFFASAKEEICFLEDIALIGRHNLSNVLAAVTVGRIFDISRKDIKKTIKKFKGLEGRLEMVRIINGVRFVNDTTATIPQATLAALRSLPVKRVILIAGGADKNLDFNELAQAIIKRVKGLVLLEGTATPKLKEALSQAEERAEEELEIVGPLSSLAEAVAQAKAMAQEGDIVLLSPASASFGLFRHEFERGNKFKEIVLGL